MSIKIELPKNVTNGTAAHHFFANLYRVMQSKKGAAFTIEFEKNKKIEYNLLAVFEMIFNTVGNNINVKYNGMSPKNKKIFYNKTTGFSKMMIFDSADTDGFYQYLKYFFLKQLKRINPNIYHKEIFQSMLELFINVGMHTQSKQVFVCGYYRDGYLYYTFANNGDSISYTILKNLGYVFAKESEAIDWAVKMGKSSKKESESGGLGLYTVRNIMKKHNGGIQLISGTGYWHEFKNNIIARDIKNELPGTYITIKFEIRTTREIPEQIFQKNAISLLELLGENHG